MVELMLAVDPGLLNRKERCSINVTTWRTAEWQFIASLEAS
jgi:hypothetical protein